MLLIAYLPDVRRVTMRGGKDSPEEVKNSEAGLSTFPGHSNISQYKYRLQGGLGTVAAQR